MGCLSLRVASKRSALGMGEVKVFLSQEQGFPNVELGRQIGGVTETDHKHNKLVITTSYNKTCLQDGHNKVVIKQGSQS